MNYANWIQNDAAILLVQSLVHCLWQGIALVAIAGVVAISVRNRSSQIKYVVWFATLCAMVICVPVNLFLLSGHVRGTASRQAPVNEDFLSADPVFYERETATTESSSILSAEDQLDAGAPAESPVLPQTRPADRVSRPPGQLEPVSSDDAFRGIRERPSVSFSSSIWMRITPYATSLYVVGVTFMFLRLFAAVYGGQRLRTAANVITKDPIASFASRHVCQWKWRFTPIVACCERITVPIVVGVVKPAILLPAAIATQLTPEQLEAVVLHELAHIRRYDHLCLLVQRSIEAVLFFHPAVWLVSRIVSRERENCCDDFVLRCGSDPCCYAESLVRLSELRNRRPGLPKETASALAVARGGRSQLQRRVTRILGQAEGVPNVRLTSRSLIILVAVMGACLLPLALIPQTRLGFAEQGDEPLAGDTVTEAPAVHVAESQPESKSNGLYVPIPSDGRVNDVRGIVVDTDGRPVADVVVQAVPYWKTWKRVRLRRVTDARGRFTFDDLAKNHWKFSLDEEKYPWQRMVSKVVKVPGSAEDLDISLKLFPTQTVSGVVVNEQGDPVGGVRLTSYEERHRNADLLEDGKPVFELRNTKTDAAGRFEFPPVINGNEWFFLDHPDYATTRVSADMAGGDNRLVIEKGLRLDGRVLYEGKPLANVRIKGVSTYPAHPPLDEWDVVSDEDGRFTQDRIPDWGPETDTVYAWVEAEEFTSQKYRVFTDKDGRLPIVELVAQQRAEELALETIDVGKAPEPTVEESATEEPPAEKPGGTRLSIRLDPQPADADSWSVRVSKQRVVESHAPDWHKKSFSANADYENMGWSVLGVPGGRYEVSCLPRGESDVFYVPEMVEVAKGTKNQTVTLRMGTASLSGVIRGLEFPPADHRVRCILLDHPEKYVRPYTNVSQSGEYQISGLPPGDYVIVMGHNKHYMMANWYDVEIGPGENRFDIQLAQGRIEGRVFGKQLVPPDHHGIGDIWVSYCDSDLALGGCVAIAVADAEGRFHVSNVPPGEYCVHTDGDDDDEVLEAFVTVADSPKPVTVRLEPPRNRGEIAGRVGGLPPLSPEELGKYSIGGWLAAYPKTERGYDFRSRSAMRLARIDHATGNYRFRYLAAGTWGVMLHPWGPSATSLAESLPVWTPDIEVRHGLSRRLDIEAPSGGRIVDIRFEIDGAWPKVLRWTLHLPDGTRFHDSMFAHHECPHPGWPVVPLRLPLGKYAFEVDFGEMGHSMTKFEVVEGDEPLRITLKLEGNS